MTQETLTDLINLLDIALEADKSPHIPGDTTDDPTITDDDDIPADSTQDLTSGGVGDEDPLGGDSGIDVTDDAMDDPQGGGLTADTDGVPDDNTPMDMPTGDDDPSAGADLTADTDGVPDDTTPMDIPADDSGVTPDADPSAGGGDLTADTDGVPDDNTPMDLPTGGDTADVPAAPTTPSAPAVGGDTSDTPAPMDDNAIPADPTQDMTGGGADVTAAPADGANPTEVTDNSIDSADAPAAGGDMTGGDAAVGGDLTGGAAGATPDMTGGADGVPDNMEANAGDSEAEIQKKDDDDQKKIDDANEKIEVNHSISILSAAISKTLKIFNNYESLTADQLTLAKVKKKLEVIQNSYKTGTSVDVVNKNLITINKSLIITLQYLARNLPKKSMNEDSITQIKRLIQQVTDSLNEKLAGEKNEDDDKIDDDITDEVDKEEGNITDDTDIDSATDNNSKNNLIEAFFNQKIK